MDLLKHLFRLLLPWALVTLVTGSPLFDLIAPSSEDQHSDPFSSVPSLPAQYIYPSPKLYHP